MQGLPLLTASLLVSSLAFLPGCSSSQVVDDETAAEAALDEAGAPSDGEEGLSETERLARKIREEEAAKGPEKLDPPKTGTGLVVLPPVERDEADEESDPDLDVGGEYGGSGDDEPDESVGAIEAESGADMGYVEDE